VAISAQLGNIGPVCLVSFVEVREDRMLPMAVCAIGRIRILQDVGFTVFALKIIFGDLGMTIGAIHTSRSFARSVPLRIDICMTLHTRNVPVLRVLNVFFVDSHGNLLSFSRFIHILFFMAFEAFTVRCPKDQACSTYSMGPVTVSAGRNSSWLLFPEFSFDDFYMHFFDPGMALRAGFCDVAGRHCRLNVRMGKNEMIAVTVVTRCRHN
jgi:hypothetical protein